MKSKGTVAVMCRHCPRTKLLELIKSGSECASTVEKISRGRPREFVTSISQLENPERIPGYPNQRTCKTFYRRISLERYYRYSYLSILFPFLYYISNTLRVYRRQSLLLFRVIRASCFRGCCSGAINRILSIGCFAIVLFLYF